MDDDRVEIKTYQDLQCWREARDFFKSLAEALEEGSSPARKAVAGDLLREASGMVGDITGSFSRTDAVRFRTGLMQALESCRRIQGLLHLAEDLAMLQEKRAEAMRKQVDSLSSSLKETVRYLVNVEIKKQYRDLDDL